MIFDNYDDPAAFSIQDFFPGGELGAILVTSRHADAGELVVEDSTSFIKLQGLEKDAALDLLIQQSQTKEPNSEDAENIVERLGYHPLAITQAGAYIRKRKIAFCKFLDDYKHRRKMILENTPQLSQYRKKLGNAEKETSLNVFTTWELSFQQLQSQTTRDGIETRFLTLFAFFDNKDISEQLFAKFAATDSFPETTKLLEWLIKGLTNEQREWESDLFRDILITLRDLSLLQAFGHEPDGFYHLSLHPLVKDWIQLRIDKSAYQENTLRAAILVGGMIASSFDLPLLAKQALMIHVMAQEENYEICSNLQSTMSFSQEGLKEYIHAQDQFAWFLLEMGLYGDAEKITKRVIAGFQILLGIEHTRTLIGKARLASIYVGQARWEEAEKLELQVIEMSKRVIGPEHPQTLNSLSTLAWIYGKQGRWKEAEKLDVQVIETMKRVLGVEHPDTLSSISTLVMTYHNQGRLDEAEELAVPAVETIKKVLGVKHPSTLMIMWILASIYDQQGRLEEAEELAVPAVETSKKVLGVKHPSTLISMWILASIYDQQGRLEEAEELAVTAVETSKKVLGVKHPSTVNSIVTLASIYNHQGRWKEAEKLHVQVVETTKKVLGVEHLNTLTSMNNLATTYKLQSRYDEAEKLEVQVVETRKKVPGVEHLDTWNSMEILAYTYKAQKRNDEAIDLLKDVVDGYKRTVGVDHQYTLNAAHCLNAWMLESDSSPHDLDLKALIGQKADQKLQDKQSTELDKTTTSQTRPRSRQSHLKRRREGSSDSGSVRGAAFHSTQPSDS